MPIHTKTNLYPGVNAHLNSYLQAELGWHGFQNSYVNALLRALTEALPPGYFATNEQSLQIIRDGLPERTVPDATIYTTKPDTTNPAVANPAPMMTVKVAQTLPEATYVPSVVIYAGDSVPGRPLVRFEMLSPANKPGGSHYDTYTNKRASTLHAGLRLVEIDLLHHQAPIAPVIPSYRDGQPNAKPYYIWVNDPRPDVEHGETFIYGVGVLDTLPTLELPLLSHDVARIDFNTLYGAAFTSSGMYALVTDYAADPPGLDAYTPSDRKHLADFLAQIRYTKGTDDLTTT